MNQNGAHPPRIEQDMSELALAARYAPRILFDRHEPFTPLAVGYTIFDADGYSPSFPRCVGLSPIGRPPAALAIEYSIWWDWDIQHLYELEHVWTYVNVGGAVVHAEGSWHGDFGTIRRWRDGSLPLYNDSHPTVYSQPGKHAFAPTEETFVMVMKDYIRRQCSVQSDKWGLMVKSILEDTITPFKTPETDRLVNAYLKTQAFEPAFAWEQPFDVTADMLIPWPTLADWIPKRIDWLLTWLRSEV